MAPKTPYKGRKPGADYWGCPDCGVWVKPSRDTCFRKECGCAKPRRTRLYKNSPEAKERQAAAAGRGGPSKPNERRAAEAPPSKATPSPAQEAEAKAKAAWLDTRRRCEGIGTWADVNECPPVKKAREKWQAALQLLRDEDGPEEESASAGQISRKLRDAIATRADFKEADISEPGVAEAIAKLDKDIADLQAASGKTPGDALKSCEAKRKHKLKQLEDSEAAYEAKIEARKRAEEAEAAADAARAEARKALDDAEEELAKARKAAAHPLPGIHLDQAQVSQIALGFAAGDTVFSGWRDLDAKIRSKKQVDSDDIEQILRAMGSITDAFTNITKIVPPALRERPVTDIAVDPAALDRSAIAELGTGSLAGAAATSADVTMHG